MKSGTVPLLGWQLNCHPNFYGFRFRQTRIDKPNAAARSMTSVPGSGTVTA